MNINSLSEVFWKKIKYVLIFILSLTLIYIIQTKFILKIPLGNNRELLEAIDNYETILEKQVEYTTKVDTIYKAIEAMEFDIHQVQKKDEINKDIIDIRSIYTQNKMNSKYLFGIQSANILQIYFDAKEEYSAVLKNKKIILDNLNECKANI